MKTNFVDNTLWQLDNALRGDKQYIDDVIADAKLVISTLRDELLDPKLRQIDFRPGEKVYVKFGDVVCEGEIYVSGQLYDGKHTEPLQYVGYRLNVNGVWIRGKWDSVSTKGKPYRTKEEADNE
jgi:hypothetical protein